MIYNELNLQAFWWIFYADLYWVSPWTFWYQKVFFSRKGLSLLYRYPIKDSLYSQPSQIWCYNKKNFKWHRVIFQVLGYFSRNAMFLQLSEKKVLDPNGPYTSTFQTILKNVCLSVISEFFLSCVCLFSV